MMETTRQPETAFANRRNPKTIILSATTGEEELTRKISTILKLHPELVLISSGSSFDVKQTLQQFADVGIDAKVFSEPFEIQGHCRTI
ncbi:hypothetical protein [Thalassospira xiamenensis]|uniref:Uncharacterized protein n=1 Tax=Thalassospira xiamenensis TaxID=220697 RepID=A0A285TI49_9PROT|nr:hypothetical protein [Thalassospira xiamenensis]SOC21657.1 hypothetical protein SAMN05428964_103461 [Thalassospira xiamenensis]